MAKRIIIISSIVILTFGYAVYHALKLDKKLSSNNTFFQSNSVLQNLPDVKVPVFNSKESVDLRALAEGGNNLIVHFWATWCGPCEQEFPEIVELTERMKNKKDLKFLFIAVNDEDKNVKKFLKKYNVDENNNFLILEDDESIHQKYFGTYKLPETYVFGSNGKLLRKFNGPQKWLNPAYVNYLLNL